VGAEFATLQLRQDLVVGHLVKKTGPHRQNCVLVQLAHVHASSGHPTQVGRYPTVVQALIAEFIRLGGNMKVESTRADD